MGNSDKKNSVERVDDKFDKAERIWDRFQKLLLKIVGGVVGISLAIYIAYGQLKDKHEEHFEKSKTEHVEETSTEIEESAPKHKEEYKITKKSFIVDDFGHRKGDTVYLDYYDDGFIDKYYATDGKIYYEED
jgi:hypothetical protein